MDLTLPTVAENLALDEALLLQAEFDQTTECLRFWEWPKIAVVLGAGGRIGVDVDEAACNADGIPLYRRSSGGGTVLLGQGCLMYSLVLSFDRARELRDVTASYRWMMGRIRDALQSLEPRVEIAGISDLSIAGCKFSGNAQQRKSNHLLQHGTILYQYDLSAIPRYLRMPERQPAYRQNRGHDDFVRNFPATSDQLKVLLAKAWEAVASPPTLPIERLSELMTTKYGNPDWIHRR